MLLLALLLGCAADSSDPDCDPLVPDVCALPWPSSRFLVEADTPTGYRLALGETTLPESDDDVQVAPTYLNEKDGFSISGPMLAWFPDLSGDGLIDHDHVERYADDDATTVIVDVETGERVPHFAEIDQSAEDDDERLLMLRPVQPLRHAARYAVGIRGLVTTAGEPVEVSPAFSALRAGKRSDRRDHFDDVVFPALEAQGFARGDLQLAWDFVTMSQEAVQAKALAMRDDALAHPVDPDVTLEVDDRDCSAGNIARDVQGKFTAPLYTVEDAAGTVLTRGPDGLPVRNGTTRVDFRLRIPCSVWNDPHPAPILQYGHGFFGDLGEVGTGWLADFANRNGYVVVGGLWTGMAARDVGAITQMILADPSDFAMLPERSQQGFVENLLLGELVAGALADDPALQRDGVRLVDTDDLRFYGNSEGGIFGGALVTLSPRIHRAVLGVSGSSYNLMLDRSNDFEPFFRLLKGEYHDHRDILLLLAAFQTVWDAGETAGWGLSLAEDDTKSVLIQSAIGDAQVNALASAYQARMVGASLVDPPTRELFGFDVAEPGSSGSAFVEYAYAGVPDVPFANLPPDEATDTHECVRRDVAGQAQVVTFLDTGVVTHTCDGPCVERPLVGCP